MTRLLLLSAASMLCLSACAQPAAAAPPVKARYLAAQLLNDAPSSEVRSPPSAPGLARKSSPSWRPSARAHPPAPLTRVEAAKRTALREPDSETYAGAVQVYPWSEGGLYRLYAAPGQVTDIALQPGETLVSVAAGDTVRWIIGDTSSGSGATRRSHVLVKPSGTGLSTNLVIATDRRVYHVDARSNARTAMTGITWTYPEDALLALRGVPAIASDTVSAAVAVDRLNFDYRIEGDNVPWRPVRAFDDGRQVFIEFSPTFAEGEAPPLFVTAENGAVALVNYRVRGHYYVVDRLFSAAELRLGEKDQKVVRILREVPGSRAGRRSR
jgi:type IV secretion system protein VirB9